MKFATTKEHRDFFQRHGAIEFEGLLNEQQLLHLNQVIDRNLTEKVKTKKSSDEEQFLHGRDLWRADEELRKWASQSRFAEITFELIDFKPLRLGYDQLFPPVTYFSQATSKEQIYARFLRQKTTLNQVSNLEGIVCGLMLCLTPPSEKAETSVEEVTIFSRQPGHGVFFRPDFLVDFEQMYQRKGQRYYLIVYTKGMASYKEEPNDPHLNELKQFGYFFGDPLSEKYHPTILR